MPIVVELTGSLLKYLHLHFKFLGISKTDEKINIQSREKLYGTIDGLHVYYAIHRLQSSDERWEGFLWFVFLVKGGQSMERYTQLARF